MLPLCHPTWIILAVLTRTWTYFFTWPQSHTLFTLRHRRGVITQEWSARETQWMDRNFWVPIAKQIVFFFFLSINWIIYVFTQEVGCLTEEKKTETSRTGLFLVQKPEFLREVLLWWISPRLNCWWQKCAQRSFEIGEDCTFMNQPLGFTMADNQHLRTAFPNA